MENSNVLTVSHEQEVYAMLTTKYWQFDNVWNLQVMHVLVNRIPLIDQGKFLLNCMEKLDRMKYMPHHAIITVPIGSAALGSQSTASFGSPLPEIQNTRLQLPQGEGNTGSDGSLQPLETPIVRETRPPVEEVLPSIKPCVLSLDFRLRTESHLKRPAQEITEKRIMKILKFEESAQEEIQSENEKSR